MFWLFFIIGMSSSMLYLLLGGLVLFTGKSRKILRDLCSAKTDSNSFKLLIQARFIRKIASFGMSTS
jgi:hypothetical protein